jgi:hypothetical protein
MPRSSKCSLFQVSLHTITIQNNITTESAMCFVFVHNFHYYQTLFRY